MSERKFENPLPRRRYTDQFDIDSMGFFTLDRNGRIIKATSSGAKLLGLKLDNLLNQPFSDFIAADFQKRFNVHCKRVLEEQIRQSCDLKLKNDNKRPLYVQIESKAIKIEAKNDAYIQTTVTNITDRKQAEQALQQARTELEHQVAKRTAELAKANAELRHRIHECELAQSALRASEQKYSTLVEDALIGVYIVQEGKIAFANDKFCEIYGYSKEELIGMRSLELVHPEDRRRIREIREKRLSGQKVPSEYEIRGLKKNGATIWVMRSYSLINYKGKPAISGIVADMTKRRLAEDALRKSDKELRILSKQLLSAEEKERKRIARELHDGIGQTLSAIKFSVENALRDLHHHRKSLDLKPLQTVIPLIQKTIDEVRRIVKDLRPSILDDLGILATIAWLCREFQSVYSSVRIEKQIDITEDDIPPPLKTIIYRILQEALNNVAKHSRADQVYLAMHKKPKGIELLLKDNGIGFDLEKTTSLNPSRRGFGLASMRERAALSGARFDLDSQIGKGTTISVSWVI